MLGIRVTISSDYIMQNVSLRARRKAVLAGLFRGIKSALIA